MIKKFILVSLVIVLVFASLWLKAPRADEEADHSVEEIQRLSLESRQKDLGCQAYLDQLRLLSAGSEKKEYFLTRDSALGVLKRIPNYPGTPIATSEALEELMSMSSFPSGRRVADLRIAVAGLSHCRSIEFFGFLTRLVDPRTREKFHHQELRQLRYALLSYLKREANEGPRFFFQVEKLVDLTAKAESARLIRLPASAHGSFEDLRWKLAKLKREESDRFADWESQRAMTRAGASGDEGSLLALLWQLDRSEEIRGGLQDVLDAESEYPADGPILLMNGPYSSSPPEALALRIW